MGFISEVSAVLMRNKKINIHGIRTLDVGSHDVQPVPV